MYNINGFMIIESKTKNNILYYLYHMLNKIQDASDYLLSLYHDDLNLSINDNLSIDELKEQIFTMKTCDETYIAKLDFEYAGTRPFKQTAYSVLDISENNSDNLNDVINSTVFDIDYYEKDTNNKTLKHFDMHTIPSYANGSFKLENKLSDENCFKLEYSTFNLIDPNLKCTTYNPAEVLKNDKLF